MLLNSRSRSIDLVRVHKAGPSGQTLQGSFSAVSMQIFENNKHSFESSLRDLHNALLCTVLNAQNFRQKSLKILLIFSPNFGEFDKFSLVFAQIFFSDV